MSCGAFFAANEQDVAFHAHEYYAALMHGGGIVSEEYNIAEICQRYGWTWQQYHDQPLHFLRTIVEKLKVEHEVEEHRKRNSQ